MGDRDTRSTDLPGRYETNLVQLSKVLRKDGNEPNAKFVCASPGQTKKDGTVAGGETLDAMQAVDGKSRKHAEFKGNVSSIYTHLLSKAGSSVGHCSGNSETYMNGCKAIDKVMVDL
ncbi:MAG: hypothetical protein OSA98_15580 [Rubripirellula sp.]|nr:hypothetical protein [Rubripirellula sp.]